MERDRQETLSALIATFTFPPDINGVAEASCSCARTLLDAGWKVDIATAPSKATRKETLWGGAAVYEFDLENALWHPKGHIGIIDSYRKFLKEGSWDVVIFQGYHWPLQLAAPLLSAMKAQKVLVSHGYAALRWFPVRRFPFGLVQWGRSVFRSLSMLRWIHRIDRWVFLSPQYDFNAYFDHTLARLARHRGIRIIPNGVGSLDSGQAGATFRATHGIAKDAFVFLCVAYYSRGKDQGLAVRAFRQAKIPGSVLVFIGTEFNEWSRKFQNADSIVPASERFGRIVWLEKQTRSDTLAAYRESDALVLSSHLETQPIVILEAMSLGKPWIGLRAGCIPTLPGGLCVRSQYSMAQAMCRIAGSAELRSRMSAEGQKAAMESFSREKIADSYRLLLKELLASRGSPAKP
jgi:glycosyltransferase involved in cell wall biosynthesis